MTKTTKHRTTTANNTQAGGSHYKDMGVQPWEVIDCWPIEQQIGYHRGNVLKYNMRMGSKDDRIREAEKGLHYQQKLIEVLREADAVAELERVRQAHADAKAETARGRVQRRAKRR